MERDGGSEMTTYMLHWVCSWGLELHLLLW